MGALELPFEKLPLGFRFKPTDVELINHYLRLKVNGMHEQVDCITEVDICKVEPWDLPGLSAIRTTDHEWFFFCPRDRKYPNGHRSNRATLAGYWKATGKDRTIKSRKMGLIGMKKTLVFYTGRAPKGKRTTWVIHEYRTTLEELDGSGPGQGAFVLCRLFKKADELKADENDDASNSDEFETTPHSSHVNAHEEMTLTPQVLQMSTLSNGQTVEQPKIDLNRVIKTSDSMASETVLLDHSHSDSYGYQLVDSKAKEEIKHEVESEFNEAMKSMYGTPDSHITQNQMHVNQGIFGIGTPYSTDIGDSYNGLQLHDVSESDPISHFLNSVLIDPDDTLGDGAVSQGASFFGGEMWRNTDNDWMNDVNVKETGSCSGSDVEVAQMQHDAGFIGCIKSEKYYNEPGGIENPIPSHIFPSDEDIFSDAALDQFCNLSGEQMYSFQPTEQVQRGFKLSEDGNHGFETGIKLRTRGVLPQSLNSARPQGTASRRIRLQMKPEGSMFEEKDSEATAEFAEDSSTVAPQEQSEKIDASEETESSVDDGEVVETGIKIRTHLRRCQPTSTPSFVEQGTARRRIRLQKRFQPQSSKLEDREFNNRIIYTEKSDGGCDQKQKRTSYFRAKSAVYMIKVVVVVVVFMASVGLWKARDLILVSS